MSYVTVDDIEIYYEVPHEFEKRGEISPVLLIHGAGGSSQHWQPLLAHLSDHLCPILVDLPGHGRSGGTVPPTVDEAVTVLEHFLTQLGVEHSLSCIGHSLGGLIAQQFALRYTKRIAQLVLIATAARIRPHPDFVNALLTGQWDLENLRASFAPHTPREVQDMVLNELPKTRIAAGTSTFMNLDEIDMSQQIAALSIPTLIIAGRNDVVISPRYARLLHQKIPFSTLLVIPDSGHYIQAEQPEVVAQALHQFLLHKQGREG